MELEELVKERIKENEKLFTEKELHFINNNGSIINKIYILVFLDIEYKKSSKKVPEKEKY